MELTLTEVLQFFGLLPNIPGVLLCDPITATVLAVGALAGPAVATGFQIDAANKQASATKELARQEREAQRKLLEDERRQRAKMEQEKAQSIRQAAERAKLGRTNRQRAAGGGEAFSGRSDIPANQQLGNFGSQGKTLIGI